MLNRSKVIDRLNPTTDEIEDTETRTNEASFSDLNIFPIIKAGSKRKLIVYRKPRSYKEEISGRVKSKRSTFELSFSFKIFISIVLLLIFLLRKV